MHAIMTKLMSFRSLDESVILSKHTVSTVAFLTKYQIRKEKIFNLLKDGHKKVEDQINNKKKEGRITNSKPITHWKSRIMLSGLSEPFSMSKSDLPYEILHLFQLTTRQQYMPVIYLSDVRQRLEDIRELPNDHDQKIKMKETKIMMPLEVVYEPITIGRLRLMVIVERAFRMMKGFGFTDRDVEDVKGIFFDTNHFMLLLTIMIVSFHVSNFILFCI